MTYTDRPTDGQQEDCASDPRLTTTIRMHDRATKSPTEVAGPSDLVIATEENKS